MNREAAVSATLGAVPTSAFLVTTTGLISREVFAQRDRDRNLYLLGSMGLASSIGLGLALLRPSAHVVVLEGDGSALMSLGALPSIAAERPPRFTHVILDNEAYESTGSQPSISNHFDLSAVGTAAGYASSVAATDADSLTDAIREAIGQDGPFLVVAKVALDASLRTPPRVSLSPTAIRDRFRLAFSNASADAGVK
jgi:thiamine pyrophosphate-dependent acetolactate synthase large subunit-like protein